MTVSGILNSPSQRRIFLLATGLVLLISTAIAVAVAYFAPNTPTWNVFNNILASIISSGIFAVVATLYLSYFFRDPNELEASSILLPEDIGQKLISIAKAAPDYQIYVRTGRHFRAETLPVLLKTARESRRPIQIDVVLLNPRNHQICEKYAQYRMSASFDKKSWSTQYVKSEIMATILTLIDAAHSNQGLVNINLFLSDRLSIFRIEGSSNEILITREDPKDTAYQYKRSDHHHAAFSMEFAWIRNQAFPVIAVSENPLPSTLVEIFGTEIEDLDLLETAAREAMRSPSPYAR